MAGTYEFADDMCSEQGGSALCIDRSVTIEAEVAGSVVLDAKGARRVVYVSAAGRAELVGLIITGGNTADYESVRARGFLAGKVQRFHFEPSQTFHPCNTTLRAPPFGLQGGGIFVSNTGVANFEGCNIHDNVASSVCLHLLNFPELSSIAPLVC